MKFVVFKTSDVDFKEAEIVEIHTIEQLIDIANQQKNFQNEVIIGKNYFKYDNKLFFNIEAKFNQTDRWFIEIHNDWRK